MQNSYKCPMLITLEGNKMAPALNPPMAMYNRDYSTMGFLDFLWKPSEARKTYGTISAGATAVAALVPVTAPIAGSIAAASGVAAGAMQVAYGVNKGGSGDPPSQGTGYNSQGPPPVVEEPVKKPNLLVPAIVGLTGLIAAFGIMS